MGKKASSRYFSFKQWLVIAFLVLGLIFSISYLIAINTLAFVSESNQKTVSHAIHLSELGRELASTKESMERYGRQFIVLGDQNIFTSYQNAANKSLELLQALSQLQATTSENIKKWQNISAAQTQILQSIDTLPAPNLKNNALIDGFHTLDVLQENIQAHIQSVIEANNKELISNINQRQSIMRKIMVGLIVVILAVSVLLSIWLARPFKSIESAISRLGENRFKEPIHITGPADIRRLGQKLDWLRLRLAEIDSDKARFLRHTSHELKTPLAALREGISLLQDEVVGELSNKQEEVVNILQQNILSLQKQIEDLLQFNAVAFDAQKLNRKPAQLLKLINDLVTAQQLQWQTSNLQINISGEDVELEIDVEKIATAMSNLLSNAIRFSPVGGKINVHLSTTSDSVNIDVTDQGVGISSKDKSFIFDPFYQGEEQPLRKTSGSGIGLSIVHELISAHGGQVQLISSNQGAHFRIQLPHVEI